MVISTLLVEVTELPYFNIGETVGVANYSVPAVDDGVSSPIFIKFPFGSHDEATVYVCSIICQFALYNFISLTGGNKWLFHIHYIQQVFTIYIQ